MRCKICGVNINAMGMDNMSPICGCPVCEICADGMTPREWSELRAEFEDEESEDT